MKSKILSFIFIFSLVIGVFSVKNNIVYADERQFYTNAEDCMHSLGYTNFQQKSNCVYIITQNTTSLFVYEIEGDMSNVYFGAKNETDAIYLISDINKPVIRYEYYSPELAIHYNNYGVRKTDTAHDTTVYYKEVFQNKRVVYYTYTDFDDPILFNELDIYKLTSESGSQYSTFYPTKDVVMLSNNIKRIEPDNVLDVTLKLQNVTSSGFKYNGLDYVWTSEIQEYIASNDLEDYIVIYDDYEKQLVFIWAFNGLMINTRYELVSFKYYYYYTDILTKPNSQYVEPYCYTSYIINSDGTLTPVQDINTEQRENNYSFRLGYNNTEYRAPLDDFTNFHTYQDYVLENYIVASNCNIYNANGALIKEPVEINNEIIVPEVMPDNVFESIKQTIYTKFPIITTSKVFIDKFTNVLETMRETDKAPEIIMTVNDFYGYSGELNVLDMTWYEPYREYVKAILSALLIVPFILWVYRKGIPDAIGGI